MEPEQILAARARRVEARTEHYIHRAKHMVLELFGKEAAQNQAIVTLQLATAMIHLEAAEVTAASAARIAKSIETKGA